MAFSKLATDFNGAYKVPEVEISYRNQIKASERVKINSSEDAYKLLMRTWDMKLIDLQEQFKLLLLDRNNSCIGVSTIGTGGITGCVADLRLAFAIALKTRAVGMILAHNHPSGNLKPSLNDKTLTWNFEKAGRYLDVTVVDHLVLTKEAYTSFADKGFMPPINKL